MDAPQETVEPVEQPAPTPAPTRKQKWLRRLRNSAIVGAVSLAAFLLFLWSCFAEPPELASEPPILKEKVQVDRATGRATIGKSWFVKRPGASLLYVEGDPFTIGYTNASLTAELLEHQERSLIETVRSFFPSAPGFLAIATVVLINNRSLPDYVPEEYQLEIYGLSRGSPDPYPEYGPRYHRILNYHAAHDISHWVWDKPVVGCTAFAANGESTAGDALLIGRNFDFEAGRHFDTNKIIGLYRPEQGHAFLSVSWPGMAGAVTGINEQRIYCSINGAHSEDKGRIGTPVSLVVRRVLQYAGSLEEAVKIIEDSTVFVTDSYLVADGKTGEAVIVEKSPSRAAVRDMAADGLLFQTNHFEAPAFAQDPGNLQHQEEGTTCARHERLVAVVRDRLKSAVLDPATAVAILRDRSGPGGVEVAPGNRSTINPFIATHSVVCDLTRGVLWVSAGPHQLGAFEAYSIDGFGGPAPAPEIAADPALANGAYERLQEARSLLEKAKEDPVACLADVTRALELNPGDPHALELLGRAAELQGNPEAAIKHYRAALSAHPPFPSKRTDLEARLSRLGK